LCKHVHPERYDKPRTCEAFPTGILEDILKMRRAHLLPIQGDHGIQYQESETWQYDRETQLALLEIPEPDLYPNAIWEVVRNDDPYFSLNLCLQFVQHEIDFVQHKALLCLESLAFHHQNVFWNDQLLYPLLKQMLAEPVTETWRRTFYLAQSLEKSLGWDFDILVLTRKYLRYFDQRFIFGSGV
jgi:hypothetical protein